MTKFRLFIITFSLYMFFSHKTLAATQSLTVTNIPATIDESQEFTADVTFSCPSCTGDSYLRGVFYLSGSNYFGYTQDNDGSWSNAAASDCNTFYKVALSELSNDGIWTGKIKFKLDKENSYYKGPGEYLFKIGRYTPSCGPASVWSSESTITITGPTPTPIPSNTPTPTNIPTPTKTPTPTLTPTPTRGPTPTKTPTPTIAPTKKLIPTPTVKAKTVGISVTPKNVLGSKTKSVLTSSPSISPGKTVEAAAFPVAPVAVIISGFIFGCCGILMYLKGRKK